jgi:hypothetical protein
MAAFLRLACAAIAAVVQFGAGLAHGAEPLRLEREYELTIQGNWAFDRGSFYGPEQVPIGTPSGRPFAYRFIATDAITGANTILTEPAALYIQPPMYFTPDHIAIRGGNPSTFSVLDRRSGAALGSLQIAQGVRGAATKDGTLYLLHDNGGGISTFGLPDLRSLGEERVVQALNLQDLILAEDRVLGFLNAGCRTPCRFELVASNLQGNVTARISVAAPERRPGRYCGPAIESAIDARVIVRLECGRYAVLDLDRQELAYQLPTEADADFFNTSASDGLLFARSNRHMRGPTGQPRTGDVLVLDLATGRELARVRLPEGRLIAVRDKLLVVSARSAGQVSVYSVDKTVLYDDDMARQNVTQAVQRAQMAANPYESLAQIETVSLSAILESPPDRLSEDQFQFATLYARCLAFNPLRAREGATLLARLADSRIPNIALRRLSDAAARRAAYFHSDAAVREKAISESWSVASQRPLISSIILRPFVDYGSLFERIYFHDHRAFVPYWDGSVKLRVFDRSDWSLLATIAIMNGDSTKQENIDSVGFAGGRLFVSLGNRYPNQSDVNFYAYDLTTLERVAAVHIPENGPALVPGAEVLGICDRWATQLNRCRAISAATLEPSAIELKPTNAQYILRRLESPTASLLEPYLDWSLPGVQVPIRPELADPRFSVTKVDVLYPESSLEFQSTDGQGPPFRFPFRVTDNGFMRALFTDDGSRAIITQSSLDMVRFYSFDIASKEAHILVELPVHYYKGAVTDGRTLFLAWDRTLMAVDMRTGGILDAVDPYDRVEGEPPTRRMEIQTLFVVDGRLVVLAPGGPARVLDLKRFYELSEPSETPFASTAAILTVQ